MPVKPMQRQFGNKLMSLKWHMSQLYGGPCQIKARDRHRVLNH